MHRFYSELYGELSGDLVPLLCVESDGASLDPSSYGKLRKDLIQKVAFAFDKLSSILLICMEADDSKSSDLLYKMIKGVCGINYYGSGHFREQITSLNRSDSWLAELYGALDSLVSLMYSPESCLSILYETDRKSSLEDCVSALVSSILALQRIGSLAVSIYDLQQVPKSFDDFSLHKTIKCSRRAAFAAICSAIYTSTAFHKDNDNMDDFYVLSSTLKSTALIVQLISYDTPKMFRPTAVKIANLRLLALKDLAISAGAHKSVQHLQVSSRSTLSELSTQLFNFSSRTYETHQCQSVPEEAQIYNKDNRRAFIRFILLEAMFRTHLMHLMACTSIMGEGEKALKMYPIGEGCSPNSVLRYTSSEWGAVLKKLLKLEQCFCSLLIKLAPADEDVNVDRQEICSAGQVAAFVHNMEIAIAQLGKLSLNGLISPTTLSCSKGILEDLAVYILRIGALLVPGGKFYSHTWSDASPLPAFPGEMPESEELYWSHTSSALKILRSSKTVNKLFSNIYANAVKVYGEEEVSNAYCAHSEYEAMSGLSTNKKHREASAEKAGTPLYVLVERVILPEDEIHSSKLSEVLRGRPASNMEFCICQKVLESRVISVL